MKTETLTKDTLDGQLRQRLDELRARGLHRSTRRIEGLAGPRMAVDGRSCLMLASSNYLNLAGDPRVLAAAAKAGEAFGTSAGGSRLINGTLTLHESLESELAAFAGHEAGLVFSTGYMANLGVLTALCGPDDLIVSDELNHASIIDACRLSGARKRIFKHNDPQSLEDVLAKHRGRGRGLLILDGVFSMDGDLAPLHDLVPIARAYNMIVVLDDAHGMGVLGAGGRGAAERENVSVDIVIGNLGKAFASFGAFIACSATMREFLVNTARSFIFTCALAPPALGAAREALCVLRAEPERARTLLERAAQLRTGLAAVGYDTGASASHIVPAILGDERQTMELATAALARGVFAHGIRYPSVPLGGARIRFTPNAGHTSNDIAEVIELFAALKHC